MNCSFIFKKVLSLIKNPQKIGSAVAAGVQAIGKQLTPLSALPDGKVEIPPLVKSTIFPVPVVIAGSKVDGHPNFNTLGNFGLINPTPPNPVVYISSVKKHYTNIGIRNSGFFSINIPSQSLMAETDYLGVVSGHDTDKSKVMTVFYGRHPEAPCLAECPLNYVCKVIHHIEIKDKDLFIGEIIESFVSSEFLSQNKIDIERIKPLLFTADYFYRVPSAPVGKAFGAFKSYKDNL